MVVKLQNYKDINTRAIQHYNSKANSVVEMHPLIKNHSFNTGELVYDEPLYDRFLHMTNHCTTDFCI